MVGIAKKPLKAHCLPVVLKMVLTNTFTFA